MGAVASQITSLTIVYSTVYSDADQRKHQSSASLTFVWGIHRGPAKSPDKWPVTRKMFPFNDVIVCEMNTLINTVWAILNTIINEFFALKCVSFSESVAQTVSIFMPHLPIYIIHKDKYRTNTHMSGIIFANTLITCCMLSFENDIACFHCIHICLGKYHFDSCVMHFAPCWVVFIVRKCFTVIITMTSYWARWRLKSPASPLFTQTFIQGADQRKHQSSASLAFVRGIHRWSVNSPHKRPVTRKMFSFHDVIMTHGFLHWGRDKMVVIFKVIFSKEIVIFRFNFHWHLLSMVQSTIDQHWFRWWIGAKQVASHYLNQRWSILLTHIGVTRPRLINNWYQFCSVAIVSFPSRESTRYFSLTIFFSHCSL